jgi:hypothetical protein
VKNLWKRFLALFHMEHIQEPISYSETPNSVEPNFVDLGVLYCDYGSMKREIAGKATKGTYRFDSENGIYRFSKLDAGRNVIICFLEHGQSRRKIHTIGL